MKARKWLAIAVVVFILGVIIQLQRSSQRGLHGGSRDDGNSEAALRDEVERLRHEVNAVGRLAGSAAGSAARAEKVMAEIDENRSSPGLGTRSDDSPARPELSEDELMRRTDERFQSEPRDSQWSGEAVTVARRHLLRGLGSHGSVSSLECRATICKAVVVYPDEAAYAASRRDSMENPQTEWTGIQAHSTVRKRSDGKVETDEYLFRPGEDPMADIFEEEKARLAASHEGQEQPIRRSREP